MPSITFEGIFPLILAFGGVQGFVLAMLLFLKGNRKYPNHLMAVFILSYALPTLNFALLNSSVAPLLYPRVILQPFMFLFGPSFFFFIKSLDEKIENKTTYVLHGSPFLIFMLFETGLVLGLRNLPLDYSLLSVLSAIVYSILTVHFYQKKSGFITSFRKFDYKQVMILCFSTYVLFTISFIILIAIGIPNRLPLIYFFGTIMTILVYSIGFIAYWKNNTATPPLSSEINKETINEIKKGLEGLIAKKIYLQSQIKLKDISNQLGVPPRYISRFVNDELDLSFPDFINNLRVQEAIRIMKEDQSNPKMLAVALDSGFSNKVSFNKHFKKYTGLTPRQFYDKNISS